MLIETFYAIFVSFIFAGTTIAGKFLTGFGITPFFLAFFRFSMSSLFLLPLINRSEIKNLNRRHIVYFLLAGIAGIFLFNVLFFAALQYTSAISVSLIGATNPILALIIAVIFSKAIPSKKQIFSLIFAFLGVSLIILHDDFGGASNLKYANNLGEFLALAAVFSQITYAMLVKQLSNFFSTKFLACLVGFSGLIFLIPFVITFKWSILLTLSVPAILALVYIGTFGGAISTTLYARVVKSLGATSANMVVFSLWPVFTFILSIIFGFIPTLWHLAGGLLVLVALILDLSDKQIKIKI